MGSWLRDLGLACRTLARSKTVTLVAVLTLALGIGLNTAIFSGVQTFLGTPVPYPQPETLVWLAQTNPLRGIERFRVSYRDGEDWREATTLESLALFQFQVVAWRGSGEPSNINAIAATPELGRVLGVGPALGRGFGPQEQEPGEHRVVILSDGLWRRQFAGNRNVLGSQIRLDGKNYAVIGVWPPDFTFLYLEADVYFPFYLPPQALADRGNRWLTAIGRLRPGAGLAQAQAEIQLISARLERESPTSNQGWKGQVLPLQEFVLPRNARLATHTIVAASVFVLLIACANIASLLLARGVLRRKEMAIRASLGALRASLIRLFLAESTVLALAGATLGVLVAYWALPILISMAPPETPRLGLIHLSKDALLYALGLCGVTALGAGAAPAWLLSRHPSAALREGSWGSTGRRQALLKLLVVAQVALAVVLLAASGLMIRSLDLQVNASPGFDKRNLLKATVILPELRYPEAAQAAAFFEGAVSELRADPQVVSAAAADSLPLGGSGPRILITVEGRASLDPRDRNLAGRIIATPGYFQTIGIPFLTGRDFDSRDGPDAQAVAIVNETMARRNWSNAGNALGRRFKLGDPASPVPWMTVVGVVKDVRHQGLALPARLEFFRPHAQSPSKAMTLLARTAIDPAALAGAMRSAVWGLDRDQPLYRLESAEEMLARQVAASRAIAKILGLLSLLALSLTAIGVYGVVAYMTSQRTREIGVRMALGAQRGAIFRLVLWSGMLLTIAGLAIGLVCAYGVTPLLQNMLAGLPPHDEKTFAAAAGILFLVSLVACSLPARRATRLDPVVTLRQE